MPSLAGTLVDGQGRVINVLLAAVDTPLPAGAVWIAGTAHDQTGQMYTVTDDGAMARKFIRGIAHRPDGVRIIVSVDKAVEPSYLAGFHIGINGAQVAADGI